MVDMNSSMGRKVYTFPRGGISFTDPCAPSKNSCVTAFLPPVSIIPFTQPSGERSNPIVSPGDAVREGMLIARSRGAGSLNIHATVPGRVIRMVSYKGAGGELHDAFAIRMEGSFEKLGKREEARSWESLLSYDIQRIIMEYGVQEMEGSSKPVSELIHSVRSVPLPITLVVRCVFDDPWLAAEYVLCKERTRAIAEGAAIMARTCRIGRILYAVSANERELGEKFLAASGNWGVPTGVVLVGSRYPHQNKRELQEVLRSYGKREVVALGSLLILGPATLAAVFDAVKLKKPSLERYVSVGGSAVKQPQVMRVRIGTRVGDLFAECGGFTGVPGLIASGSPLMGKRIIDLDEPVLKTTNAIFALDKDFSTEAQTQCISCGECRIVCPRALDPEELYKKITLSVDSGSALKGASACHACGCCEVVCPSRLPLGTTIAAYGGNRRDGNAISVQANTTADTQAPVPEGSNA